MKLLFLHGFAGSPRELRPLGQTLSRHGFEVMAPLLPGHGEYYSGMDSCRLEDWLDAVRLSFGALHRDGSPVAVVGYCLGGTLALATARELNPRAVVVLAAPVLPLETAVFPTFHGAESDQYDLLETTTFAGDCRSDLARRWRKESCHPTVTRQFLRNYQEAIAAAARELPVVPCPIAAVYSENDRVVPPANLRELQERTEEGVVRVIPSTRAGHGLPIDIGRRGVVSGTVEFLLSVSRRETSTF